MAHNRLRIYFGPEDQCEAPAPERASPEAETVTVPAGDILPWLADAAMRRRRWLRDFEDDGITISKDLYEVIMAYRFYQRPSA